MSDKQFDELKLKYQSVLNLIPELHAELENVNMQENKLFIRAKAPSQDVKNQLWNQIKLIDPQYSDLIADIEAPAAAAAAAGTDSAPAQAVRTYTVQPGDNLSAISSKFYGSPNHYMKIFEANREKLSDPNKVKAGVTLSIP